MKIQRSFQYSIVPIVLAAIVGIAAVSSVNRSGDHFNSHRYQLVAHGALLAFAARDGAGRSSASAGMPWMYAATTHRNNPRLYAATSNPGMPWMYAATTHRGMPWMYAHTTNPGMPWMYAAATNPRMPWMYAATTNPGMPWMYGRIVA